MFSADHVKREGNLPDIRPEMARCVKVLLLPWSLKKSFGRSRVASITVFPVVSSTALR